MEKGWVMHKQLEEYLAQVAEQIVSIPQPRRAEELKEMRAHLLMAVGANQEQGQTEDEAVANALKAFGTPAEASASVLIAWKVFARKHIRNGFWKLGSIWSALFSFMALFASTGPARYPWLVALAFTWIVCLVGMVVSPLWSLRERHVRPSTR